MFRRLVFSGHGRPSATCSIRNSVKRLFSSEAETVTGQSGRCYTMRKILQDKGRPLRRVYLADDGSRSVILKEIPQNFAIRQGIYTRSSNCAHVRRLLDTVPERRMFVFEYLNKDLLQLAQKKIPAAVTKHILKCALQGLAALHSRDIVHNDIKPDNILVQLTSDSPEPRVDKVELVDLEDSAHVPPGKGIRGAQLGNEMWRSPESHAMGPIQKPSDMFSFGIVCIYAMTQALLFAVDDSELEEGVVRQAVILQRQISYFADEEGFMGLMKHLGEKNQYVPIFQVTLASFGEEQPRKPFGLWEGLDIEQEDLFKDLVVKLTNFDPAKRLTAQQALDHEWFKDV